MEINNWYKLTFEIETNLEEIIIWKLNDLGIFSFAFEILLNNKNNKKVIIWLPTLNWPESLRIKLERNIKEVLDKNNYQTNCFEWNVIEQEDWVSSWKKYWGPELVGDNLLVLPCWLELPKEYKNKKVIRIDPGAAFGTGSHPTTSLCLERLEKISLSSNKILDIGSGSGILSIAALKFGASEIMAIEYDEDCKDNFHENMSLNNINEKYTLSIQDVLIYEDYDYDLIIANINKNVLVDLLPNIKHFQKNKCKIILSGLLIDDQEDMMKVISKLNYNIIKQTQMGEWICIVLD